MSCQICGRPSAAGAKLCNDCRAARRRAYDATITQPLLALAGTGTVSRTLSRLRRSGVSSKAKAKRAARNAQASTAEVAPSPVAAHRTTGSRSLLWVLLSIGVLLAAVAGWYLPSHTPNGSNVSPASSASPPAPQQATSAAGVEPAQVKAQEVAPGPSALPPLPPIVERELVPHSPAPAKPTTPKRATAVSKPVAPATEPPKEIEIVREAPPAPAPAPPQPAPRIDPWQQMNEAIGRCPCGFLAHLMCEQQVRLRYCEGHWGQVPQCPGGPSPDHD